MIGEYFQWHKSRSTRGDVIVNLYQEQELFMRACGQKGDPALYYDLVIEEHEELENAIKAYATDEDALADVMDAICDSIVVLTGLANSLVGPEAAYQCQEEVWRSNMSKVVWSGAGYVAMRREDGKIMKPPTYSPPDIRSVLDNL